MTTEFDWKGASWASSDAQNNAKMHTIARRAFRWFLKNTLTMQFADPIVSQRPWSQKPVPCQNVALLLNELLSKHFRRHGTRTI